MQAHKTCLQLCGVLYDSRIIRQLFPLIQLTIKTYDRNSGATRYQRNRVSAGAGKRQRIFQRSKRAKRLKAYTLLTERECYDKI